MAADKGAGSQFGEAIKCIGGDLKPNLATVKYDDFCFVEGRSGLGSALESPKMIGAKGTGVQCRYLHWDETQFLTKSISFYDVFGRGLDQGLAEGD